MNICICMEKAFAPFIHLGVFYKLHTLISAVTLSGDETDEYYFMPLQDMLFYFILFFVFLKNQWSKIIIINNILPFSRRILLL